MISFPCQKLQDCCFLSVFLKRIERPRLDLRNNGSRYFSNCKIGILEALRYTNSIIRLTTHDYFLIYLDMPSFALSAAVLGLLVMAALQHGQFRCPPEKEENNE